MRLRNLAATLMCWVHIVIGGAALAQEPARIALLIGNKDYKPAVGPLQNTHKDVEIVGVALKQLGFDVTIVKDADYRKMDVEIRRHTDRVRSAGDGTISFFYYSGHGVANADTNSNYLIPVDVVRADTDDIWYNSFEQSAVIDRLNRLAPKAIHLVVFDACRDELNLTRAGKKALGITKGFVPVNEVRGMLIAYATAEKRTAADTGTFAKILAEEIVRPGVEAVAMFREVQLRAEGEMNQEPWMSLRYLPRTFLANRPAQPSPVPVPQPPLSDAAAAWGVVQNAESEAVLEEYIRQFGDSVYGGFARARLAELRKRKVAVGTFPERPAPAPVACAGVDVSLGAGGSQCIKPGSGDAFRDCADCPEMVVAPGGDFMMGSPENEPGRYPNESPQRKVTIKQPFAVGKYAVTFDEWNACADDGGCKGYKPSDAGWGQKDRPVINVGWDDAQLYVTWLSKKTGKQYRLLSEAEREYVARAKTTTPFWWGGSITTVQANYDGSVDPYKAGGEKGESRRKTLPVKSFQPNPWGLYQVHGNVWEWVEDCWNDSYKGAPTDGSAWKAGDCSRRVLRGGSWVNGPWCARAAYRGEGSTDSRNDLYGFRLARTLNP
jgi:formylglycine-generating enzyme required for sulfatase activity